jgi:hypothetical protein
MLRYPALADVPGYRSTASVPLRVTAFLTACVERGSKAAEGLKMFIGREADDLYYTDAEHFRGRGCVPHVERFAAQATASPTQESDTWRERPVPPP